MRAALRQILLNSVPGWVRNSYGLFVPSVVMHFDEGRAWVQGTGTVDPASLISNVRPSNETSLYPTSSAGAAYQIFGNNVPALVPGLGLQSFGAVTNNLLNSTSPVTQTTASLATGTYTLWVNGSGSATSSAGSATGSGFGAATNGTPNTFTLSGAGTVTVTVSGSLNAFQLESGAFATPLHVTGGATSARSADVTSLVGSAQIAALAAKAGFAQITQQAGAPGGAFRVLSYSGGTELRISLSTLAGLGELSSNGTTIDTGASATQLGGTFRMSYGFDASGLSVVMSGGGTKTTSATVASGVSGTVTLGNNSGGTRPVNGIIARLALGSLAKGQFDGLIQ